MLLRTTTPALALLAALLSGCSGGEADCAGATYDVDRSAAGAKTTIDALDTWLANPEGVDELPPRDDWVVQDGGEDADEVVILNESTGDGWWVHLVRTADGGYVVDQVTNDWASCEDDLS